MFRARAVLFVGVLAGAAVAARAESPAAPASLLATVPTSPLQPERAVRVKGVNLRLGHASLRIDDALAIPVAPLANKPAELVLTGRCFLEVKPPDDIEAQQLELFTGERTLRDEITEVALVTCSEAASDAILGRGTPETPADAALSTTRATLAAWRAEPIRSASGADGALVAQALGDPSVAGFFLARLTSRSHGILYACVDPEADEPFSLGCYEPLDLTKTEQAKLSKQLARRQRLGRLLGLDLEDLGGWDTWISAPLRRASGELVHGTPPFETKSVVADVAIDETQLLLTGTATLELAARRDDRRTVGLALHRDLAVSSVRDAAGLALPFRQDGHALIVALPAGLRAGSTIALTIAWSGVGLEKTARHQYVLRNSTSWLPQLPEEGRPSREIRLTWSGKLDLVASGRVVEEGAHPDGRRWQRRVVDGPALGAGFAIGKYETSVVQAGHVAITFAFDEVARLADDGKKKAVIDAVKDSLEWYEKVLGPLPIDRMTVVSVPRTWSQGLLGFLTISNGLLIDVGGWDEILGIRDVRTVVAHEMAHQWFGNMVGWKGYRDEWLSEGVATWLALTWAHERLPAAERPRVGPVTGWKARAMAPMEDGRPVDAAGPMTLGRRLSSSKAPGAYEAIVYGKGGVVINMLSMFLGTEGFLGFLSDVVKAASGKKISTDQVVEGLEASSGQDLDWFSRRYLYGTGIPVVHYETRFEKKPDGKWRVSGTARQEADHDADWEIVKLANGRLDCRAKATARHDAEASALVVPFQVDVHDPSRPDTPGSPEGAPRRKADRSGAKPANSVVEGRMLLATREYAFDMEVPFEPLRFRLDRDGVTFGDFVSADSAPKLALGAQATAADFDGRTEEAIALVQRALAAPVIGPGADPVFDARSSALRETTSLLDALLLVRQAQFEMNLLRLDAARASLGRARTTATGAPGSLLREMLESQEARLDVLSGDPKRALARLRPRLTGSDRLASAQAWAIAAIAALQAGDAGVLSTARAECAERDVTTKALDAENEPGTAAR